MATQIVCVYTLIASGTFTGAQLVPKVNAAAILVDSQFLTDYGLSVTSDVTSAVSTTVTRTITLSMVPTVAATATATLGGGGSTGTGTGVTSVAVAGNSGYVGVPVVTFTTQAGHPAPIRPALGHAVVAAGVVTSVVVDDPGIGYDIAPNVVITPLFKSLFPDGTDQVSPLQNFMTEVIQNAALTTVVASTPVVS